MGRITIPRRLKYIGSAAGIIILLIAGLAILSSGALQTPTQLTLTSTTPPSCTDSIAYVVELTGTEGLPNELVTTYVNTVPFERLRTDQNGRFSSTLPLRPEWCGTPINLTVAYQGNLRHSHATTSKTVHVRIPTSIVLFAPDEIEVGETAKLRARLTATQHLPSQAITFTADEQELHAVTDADGYAEVTYTFKDRTRISIQARFSGDDQYQPAESPTTTVVVKEPACNDGTIVGACSTTPSYFCTTRKKLIFDCTQCGCTSGLLCYSGACVTPEQKNTALITGLQESVVLVGFANPDGTGVSGSGIVLAQHDGRTIILTNRHVVSNAPSLASVKMITIDGEMATADTIRLAPDGMDLAVIIVPGTHGIPATIDDSLTLSKGQDVVVLGSPGGLTGDILQGSVAKGIISNFETQTVYFDDADYQYNAIQTDAAINHGNSGGGLFLLSNGNLVGVNTLGGASLLKQGINFAIDIRELKRLPTYTSWPLLKPASRCDDGTAYDECSATSAGYICRAGDLVPGCKTCGCPSAYPFCPNNGNCFACPAGTNAFQTSSGDGFCCAAGYTGTVDGQCSN